MLYGKVRYLCKSRPDPSRCDTLAYNILILIHILLLVMDSWNQVALHGPTQYR